LRFSRGRRHERGIAWVNQQGDIVRPRHQLVQQLQPLGRKRSAQRRRARDIATGSAQAGYKSERNGVARREDDDRNARGRRFCRQGSGRRRRGGDDAHFATDQIGRQAGQSVVSTLRPAVVDGDILTLHKAELTKALVKRTEKARNPRGRFAAEESDHRHHRLLRMRREWPRRRAAEQRDEIAPSDLDCHVTLPSGGHAHAMEGRYHALIARSVASLMCL
jgi:hypothetical protein